MKKANALYNKGSYTAAIIEFEKALFAEENPPTTHFNIGNCWFQLDSLAKAAVHYEETIREAPEFTRSYPNLGIAYFNMNQFDKSISTLERGLIEDPSNTTMMQVLAESYMKLEKLDFAVPLFEKILEITPSKIDILLKLAEIHKNLNDLDGAIQYLNRYPNNGSNLSDKYLMLADIEENHKNNYSDAQFYLNQYSSLNPLDKWVHYKIIGLMQKQGNSLSAIYKAQEIVKQFPSFLDAALLGGNIAFSEKQYRYAEELYLSAYNNGSSGGATGLTNLGHQYLRLGDRASADRITKLLIEKPSSVKVIR